MATFGEVAEHLRRATVQVLSEGPQRGGGSGIIWRRSLPVCWLSARVIPAAVKDLRKRIVPSVSCSLWERSRSSRSWISVRERAIDWPVASSTMVLS